MPYRVRRGTSEHYGYTDTDDAKTIFNVTDTDVDDANPANPADQRGLFPDMQAARAAERDAEDGLTEAIRLKTEPMDLYPVSRFGELLPKERWLISKMKAIAEEGGTSLLYVRQTKKRNIQPRLLEILTKAGFRAVILPDGDARLREAWIQRNAQTAQVLITNAKKVETGLDLVMFNHVIFYELDYSLFTMWQAMRRVWRLGQTKAVTVTIPIHSDAMEAHALSIMANKFQAALLLYGEIQAQAWRRRPTCRMLWPNWRSTSWAASNSAPTASRASWPPPSRTNSKARRPAKPSSRPKNSPSCSRSWPRTRRRRDGAIEEPEEDYVDGDYDVVEGTGMTTLIDGTALQDLPIFAALQDLLTQPPTELINALPPAMGQPQPKPEPKPEPSRSRRPSRR